jgi:mannose-6-phosphate isomerase-like protein (cupin superfamily)
LDATSLNIHRRSGQFRPLMNSASVQAAVMSLRRGESSSDHVENEHPSAEQWLFVVSGTGVAKVGRRRIRLHSGVLLFIPKRAPHQITNTGRGNLITLNFYAPPAYTPTGDVRPSVKRLR